MSFQPARPPNGRSPTPRPTESRSSCTGAEPDCFRCDVSRESDTANVRTVGELDLATAPVLSAQIADLRQAGCRHVIIDLSDLTFIDSTGLRLILERYAESRQDGFTMALLPGPPAVQRVFELTDTTAHLPFIAS
jgi:anti-anti-sigma factor